MRRKIIIWELQKKKLKKWSINQHGHSYIEETFKKKLNLIYQNHKKTPLESTTLRGKQIKHRKTEKSKHFLNKDQTMNHIIIE